MKQNQSMLDHLAKDIQPIFGKNMAQIILYGSYARGDYNETSDIDLMILTDITDEEIEKVEDAVFDIAYEYELTEGIPISINIKNTEHFSYWKNILPYYQNIIKEGVVIAG